MNSDSIPSYLVGLVIIVFFTYRFFQKRKIIKEMPNMIQQGAIVVDVRSKAEYAMGARPGSINIPLDELSQRWKELDKSKKIILCCASGARSGMALGILKSLGFQDVVNAGSWMNTMES